MDSKQACGRLNGPVGRWVCVYVCGRVNVYRHVGEWVNWHMGGWETAFRRVNWHVQLMGNCTCLLVYRLVGWWVSWNVGVSEHVDG